MATTERRKEICKDKKRRNREPRRNEEMAEKRDGRAKRERLARKDDNGPREGSKSRRAGVALGASQTRLGSPVRGVRLS